MEQLIDSLTAQRLALTLGLQASDSTQAAWVSGTTLPLGWHVVFCQEAAERKALSEDGLPDSDPSLPAHSYGQRLFGGANLELVRPLRIGETLTCTVVAGGFTEKQGRNGPLAIYEFERNYHVARELCLREINHIIYRPALAAGANSHVRPQLEREVGVEAEERWQTLKVESLDEIDVFRFSALMFNSHRVHYDLSYAKDVAQYPGVLVQAKLMLLVALSCLPRMVQTRAARLRYRSHRPVVAPAQLEIQGQREANGDLSALRVVHDTRPCLSIDI